MSERVAANRIILPSSRLSTSTSISESSGAVAESGGQGASGAAALRLAGLDLAAPFGAEWEVLGRDADRRPTFSRGVRVTLGATSFSRPL